MHMRFFCPRNPSHRRLSVGSSCDLDNDGNYIETGPTHMRCAQCGCDVQSYMPQGWIMQEEQLIEEGLDGDTVIQLLFFGNISNNHVDKVAKDAGFYHMARVAAWQAFNSLSDEDKQIVLDFSSTEDGEPSTGLFLKIDDEVLRDLIWRRMEEILAAQGVFMIHDRWYQYMNPETVPWLDTSLPLYDNAWRPRT